MKRLPIDNKSRTCLLQRLSKWQNGLKSDCSNLQLLCFIHQGEFSDLILQTLYQNCNRFLRVKWDGAVLPSRDKGSHCRNCLWKVQSIILHSTSQLQSRGEDHRFFFFVINDTFHVSYFRSYLSFMYITRL